MSYLIGLVALLGGAFFFERSRRKSNEAIADNFDLLKVINDLFKQKSKNDGLLEAEEEKRKQIDKDTQDEKDNTDGDSNFFNNR
jgi:hypothetical protein